MCVCVRKICNYRGEPTNTVILMHTLCALLNSNYLQCVHKSATKMCVTEYDNLAALLGAFRLPLFVCNVVINWPFLQCPHNTYVLHVEHAYVRTYVCMCL